MFSNPKLLLELEGIGDEEKLISFDVLKDFIFHSFPLGLVPVDISLLLEALTGATVCEGLLA